MDAKMQLVSLRTQVDAIRSQGHVKRFPDDLKQTAVGLVEELGICRVAREANLPRRVLYSWKCEERFTEIIPESTGMNLHITRVVAEKEAPKIAPIVSIKLSEFEIQIFDAKLAFELCGRTTA